VGTLFGAPAVAAGKTYWVEKTPSNIIAMDLLWDLFPEATIVHIKRHPYGVLHSFMQQSWLPRGLEPCTRYLSHIYRRWMALKPKLDLANRKYIEIKLEDLASHPVETMAIVSEVAGIYNNFRVGELNIECVEYWKRDMPDEWRRHAARELDAFFALMGYTP
jgi:hypothetical protein